MAKKNPRRHWLEAMGDPEGIPKEEAEILDHKKDIRWKEM